MAARRLRQVMLIIPAAALALASSMLPAVAADTAGWRVQTTIVMTAKDVELTHVAADARNDAWAVGDWVKGQGGPVPLVEQPGTPARE